jgi:hypothetical protein
MSSMMNDPVTSASPPTVTFHGRVRRCCAFSAGSVDLSPIGDRDTGFGGGAPRG